MTRQSFCHNADGSPKGVFLSKRDAKKVARNLARLPGYQVEGRVLHLYHCPPPTRGGCGLWHLGHARVEDSDTGGFAA